MKCEHCGAVVAATALHCNYCQAPTAAGFRARQQAEHAEHAEHERMRWTAAQAQHASAAAKSRLDGMSTQSMWLSIAGTLVCCWPVAGAGLIQAVRARGLARKENVEAPFGAKLGLILGILGMLTSVGGWSAAIIGGNHDADVAKARIAVLEDKAKAGSESSSLDIATACALAEAHALKVGFDSHSGPTLHDFECLGKVAPDGDRATFDAFRFQYTSTHYETSVCFRHGARWYVHEMTKGTCPGASASPSAAPATSTLPKRR